MSDYLGDISIFIGCILLLIGTYILCPVATLFVASAIFITLGVLIELAIKERK